MEKIKQFLKNLINITDDEMHLLLKDSCVKNFKRSDIIAKSHQIPNEIYFVNSGIIRLFLFDNDGVEHTKYFALENQFIVDYSSFILKKKAHYALQALEPTEVVVLPRSSVEWGYQKLNEGQKLGRLIAEYYFIYQDNKIKDEYTKSPKERYEGITSVFPEIINRVPQHMIASYLGITSVHLSRLKKS